MTMIVTSEYAITRVAPPSLPTPPGEYDPRYVEQFNNVLRLYFNRLNGLFGQLNTLSVPYGAFSSDQDQTAAVNTATLMTLNTTDFSSGVSIANSKITVATAGIYNLQFSAQFVNTDSNVQDVYIWLKQSGVDIPGSTGFVSIPSRHGGTDGHAIVGWNYFLSMTAGQYIEIYWSVPNAAVSIQHLAASGTPTKPSTQSVVATLAFVSALTPA
jgi:hypothetical protein